MIQPPFRLPATWPAPHDTGAGERLLERFSELGRAEARLAKRPAMAGLLRCLGGNSPFLSDLVIREAAAVRQFAAVGPDATIADAMQDLAAIPPSARRDVVAAGMRRAKRVSALAIAIADIGGLWRLEQVTAALSALAEATLTLAVNHLLRAAHDANELRLPDPERPAAGSGFTVLGMGKLGAA